MTITSGFFQAQVCDTYRLWLSSQNIKYVQNQVTERFKKVYLERIELDYDYVRAMMNHTLFTWRGLNTLEEFLEMVITDFITDINTDIEWRSRFNQYEPRTLYFAESDITREEKVKVNPGYKFEFQMNY
jgi:hypothetical protein